MAWHMASLYHTHTSPPARICDGSVQLYLKFLPRDLLYFGIWVPLTALNFKLILAYPLLFMTLKEASLSSSSLGRINCLTTSAAAACRTAARPLSGYLYSIGARQGFTGLASWRGAAFGAIQALWVGRERNKAIIVRSPGANEVSGKYLNDCGQTLINAYSRVKSLRFLACVLLIIPRSYHLCHFTCNRRAGLNKHLDDVLRQEIRLKCIWTGKPRYLIDIIEYFLKQVQCLVNNNLSDFPFLGYLFK